MEFISILHIPLWLWFMLGALIFWSIRVLIDEYLTKDTHGESSAYKESIYGTIISGRFAGYAAIPFIIIYFIKIRGDISIEDIVCLIVAGALYLLHYHYFFILLKESAELDASWTESASSTNLVLTPFILYFLINERFNIISVIGILLVALSVSVLFLRTRNIVKNNIATLSCFIATFSGSSILSDHAYDGHTTLWSILGLLGFFYLGMALCGRAFFLSIHHQEKKDDINLVIKSNFGFLSIAELIDLSGTFFFQMAIAVAPSIILALAMLEFVPITCMLMAALFLCISWNKHIRKIALAQFKEGYVKAFSSILTFTGAILIIGAKPIEKAYPDFLVWKDEISQSTQKLVESVNEQEALMNTQLNESLIESDDVSNPIPLVNEDSSDLFNIEDLNLPEESNTLLNNLIQDQSALSLCMRNWPDCLDDSDLPNHYACQDIYDALNSNKNIRLNNDNQHLDDAAKNELTSSHLKCRGILKQLAFDDEIMAARAEFDLDLLCPDHGYSYKTNLNKDEIKETQLILSAYSDNYPAAKIAMPTNVIDGLYGKSTCRAIANFERHEEHSNVTGMLDQHFYNDIKKYNIDITSKVADLSSLQRKAQQNRLNSTRQSDRDVETITKSTSIEFDSPWAKIKYCFEKENRSKSVCENNLKDSNDNR